MRFTLKDLLQIENSHILTFKCNETGVLLWPLLRNQFFRVLISRLYYNQQPLVVYTPTKKNWGLLRIIPQLFWHNLKLKQSNVDVMLFTTGAGHFLKKGLWFNRIADYFASSHQHSVNIEGVVGQFIPEPRHYKRTYYWLLWQLIISGYGRIRAGKHQKAMALQIVKYATNRAEEMLGITLTQDEINMLVSIVAPKIARLKLAIRVYRFVLKSFSPKLLIVEQACYGDSGLLNFVAHEMGIRVAEIQHGMVSSGHDAYCFAEDICNSQEYRLYLPDDFLGYGDWWNAQINAPVKKWVIGNPHHAFQKEVFGEIAKSLRQDILLLSDGIEFDLYLRLAKSLNTLPELQNYRIVLRPHPMEREAIMQQFPKSMLGEIMLDFSRDVYQSFASASAVLGEVSTALFEAVGLVDKIFIWKTPKSQFSYPEHPFLTFSDAREFLDGFLQKEVRLTDTVVKTIWAEHWQKNYSSYLEKVLKKK